MTRVDKAWPARANGDYMKVKITIIFAAVATFLLLADAAAGQAKMIRLVKGKKTVVTGNVRDGDEKHYLFNAKEGQRITVRVIGRDAVFSLFGGAVWSEKFVDEKQFWTGRLPAGDDDQYAMVLTSFYKVAGYRLEITLR